MSIHSYLERPKFLAFKEYFYGQGMPPHTRSRSKCGSVPLYGNLWNIHNIVMFVFAAWCANTAAVRLWWLRMHVREHGVLRRDTTTSPSNGPGTTLRFELATGNYMMHLIYFSDNVRFPGKVKNKAS